MLLRYRCWPGRDELLRLAASVEKGSEHPLGEAIWAEATARGLSLAEPSGFKAEAGQGVEAEVDGSRVAVGNLRMMQGAATPSMGLPRSVPPAVRGKDRHACRS